MAKDLGGAVERTDVSEFGKTALRVEGGDLFRGFLDEQVCWMSHRDTVTAPPEGARVTAGSPSTPVAAFEAPKRGLYGVQFHPEVVHTPNGAAVLENFLYRVAGAAPVWTRARSSTSRSSASVRRWATSACYAGSRAVSTPRSRHCSCTVRWETS